MFFIDSTKQIPARYNPVREHEVLRVTANLPMAGNTSSAEEARRLSIAWVSRKIAGLPSVAGRYEAFDHAAMGRLCSAVRLRQGGEDVWAVKFDEPDKNVADRIWSTEITVREADGKQALFALRLLAACREYKLVIEPATPVLIRTLIQSPGLRAGPSDLTSCATTIDSNDAIDQLVVELTNQLRTVPFFVLTGTSYAADEGEPLLNSLTLAKSTAGLAKVFVVPARYTHRLTHLLSKPLSVYEGAARIYLPGFDEEADPYGGHELILPQRLVTQSDKSKALKRLQTVAANWSIRNPQNLELRIAPFSRLRALSLQAHQLALTAAGASDRVLLDAAVEQVKALEQQLDAAEATQQWLSDEHSDAQIRAEEAEAQLQKYSFRIQQLTSQLRETGQEPDANIISPPGWDQLADWCDANLAGRLQLTSQARRLVRNPEFGDLHLTSRCLLWLSNTLRQAKIDGGEGGLRSVSIEAGVRNEPCGGESYQIKWKDRWQEVDWHIKGGGNSRDPRRCLRMYYFWDSNAQLVVVDWLPSHRPNGS